VLVISAPRDKITAHADAKGLAKATGGELVTGPDGGHQPQARKPVAVNLALRGFTRASAFTADSRELRGAATAS
jgi:pimeloyl-ACP methyl ester carboxylesterase